MGFVYELHLIFIKLFHIFQSWGGRENGFGLADCVREYAVVSFKFFNFKNIWLKSKHTCKSKYYWSSYK